MAGAFDAQASAWIVSNGRRVRATCRNPARIRLNRAFSGFLPLTARGKLAQFPATQEAIQKQILIPSQT
jgi:hypothetical protein